MERSSAIAYVHRLLQGVLEQGGSDLFITADAPPFVKRPEGLVSLAKQEISGQQTRFLVRALMNEAQKKIFDEEMEYNFSISLPSSIRFRVNAFTQRGYAGMVLRHIPSEIPTFKQLNLPPILGQLTLAESGLILLVGSAGSGKSTTLAAMVDYRNEFHAGHIITIKDPIEFTYQHKKSLVTQREIGLDTRSYEVALKNALRQSPDVIVLGEIRDRETMQYALNYAETGHLCVSTLHANSAEQAIERIVNLFPYQRREQILMDLSLNLHAIISQKLVRKMDTNEHLPAVEILINTPTIAELILDNDIAAIKNHLEKSAEQDMQTLDQALLHLVETGKISTQEAFRHADSVNNLRLRLKFSDHQTINNALDDTTTEKIELESFQRNDNHQK
jgi:twitching motility protein PilU